VGGYLRAVLADGQYDGAAVGVQGEDDVGADGRVNPCSSPCTDTVAPASVT
jgi:hypothetical protein